MRKSLRKLTKRFFNIKTVYFGVNSTLTISIEHCTFVKIVCLVHKRLQISKIQPFSYVFVKFQS